MADNKEILVIRNDKLGDFMLAWPALSLLKKQYPHTNVTVLIPSYTRPIAELCPWIDRIITDDEHNNAIYDAVHLAKKLRSFNFDASISLFSETRTSLALWLARIPRRYGPATKLAQLFLNRKLRQKRSLSLKPEYEYNVDLVSHFISSNGDNPVELPPPPYLHFDQHEIKNLRQSYIDEQNIEDDRKLVFIHAGSGGSAINLSLQQFSELATLIDKANTVHFVLTAGPEELGITDELSSLMNDIDHSVYHSTEGLVKFSKFISTCDLFISGSTGPLHIAGALDVDTVAFYPARRSATPLRWQTINQQQKRIVFSPERYTGENDMQTIDITECADRINQHLAAIGTR
jgi:ADP-heptose:LPS heptosyltransferase